MSAIDAIQDEGFLTLLADALLSDQGHIQGFLYAKHHVIRDVSKPWAEQELWRRWQKTEDDYQSCHDEMMKRIEVERLRKAVKHALATMDRPWPGQEQAAEQARAAFGIAKEPAHDAD